MSWTSQTPGGRAVVVEPNEMKGRAQRASVIFIFMAFRHPRFERVGNDDADTPRASLNRIPCGSMQWSVDNRVAPYHSLSRASPDHLSQSSAPFSTHLPTYPYNRTRLGVDRFSVFRHVGGNNHDRPI